MKNTFFECIRGRCLSDANMLLYGLGRLPIIGNKITDKTYSSIKKVRFAVAAGIIIRMLLEIIKKTAYVAVFFMIPRMLFAGYMAIGPNGFDVDNCFVYFGIVLSCFCGSITRSVIFNPDDESYIMLRGLKADPKDYFRARLFTRSLYEIVILWPVFVIMGMNFFRALYLTIIIVLSRYMGETIQILLNRATGKTITGIPGLNIAIMLLSLFFAYFVPYMRGYVPDACNLIFNEVWFIVILIAGALFLYYVWNFNGFVRITSKVYKYSSIEPADVMKSGEQAPSDLEPEEYKVRTLVSSKKSVHEYTNRIFFYRNKKFFVKGIMHRLFIIAAVFIGAELGCMLGYGEQIYKVISYSMPVLVPVMYFMSTGYRNCKALFYHWDAGLMHDAAYRNNDVVAENFLIRLRYMILIDIIPAAGLSLSYGIIGMILKEKANPVTMVCLCVGILLLSCFFTAFHLFLYYMMKPYGSNRKLNSRLYPAICIFMGIICYLFTFVEATVLYFTLGLGLLLGVFLAVSVTFIRKMGGRTFKGR